MTALELNAMYENYCSKGLNSHKNETFNLSSIEEEENSQDPSGDGFFLCSRAEQGPLDPCSPGEEKDPGEALRSYLVLVDKENRKVCDKKPLDNSV
jgi:hypothetical protein